MKWKGELSLRPPMAPSSSEHTPYQYISTPQELAALAQSVAGESLIAGFILTGTEPVSVLVRGVGRGLIPFGVTDAMLNPKIILTDSRGTVFTNDDWGPITPVSGLPAPPISMGGAFPLAANSRDASHENFVCAGTSLMH